MTKKEAISIQCCRLCQHRKDKLGCEIYEPGNGCIEGPGYKKCFGYDLDDCKGNPCAGFLLRETC
jgi:hypothetical protein